MPGTVGMVNLPHIPHHDYCSHKTFTPNGVISPGPAFGWDEPHGRG